MQGNSDVIVDVIKKLSLEDIEGNTDTQAMEVEMNEWMMIWDIYFIFNNILNYHPSFIIKDIFTKK